VKSVSIRIRQQDGEAVALCAAKTEAKKGDIYLNDDAHHALTTKFSVDFESEGFYVGPHDEITKAKMLKAENG
jgi:hypothetical protein